MPRMDEPSWATTEAAFAEFCADRNIDETDEAFDLFERWLDDDPRDSFTDPDLREGSGGEFDDPATSDREPF